MINTVIILVGGIGTRLQSLVANVPKPMALVNNIPFLNYQLNYLKHYGIKNIIFSTGYLAEKISTYYKNNFNGLFISYSHENNPLGTGGGIRLAINSINDEEVLVLNGDSFFDVDIEQFYNLHKKSQSQISLALRQISNASRYGTVVRNANHRIVSFKEKDGIATKGIINGGVYIITKKLFLNNTLANKNFSIEKDFFEKKLNELNMYGFEFDNYFIDIGIPEDYLKAQNDFKEFEYR
jgi:D-glycero-alpha-D-manno-heptose 1-phosphate guanylyltransferase